MKEDSARFALLKRYLLGQLAEQQMREIEQRYLADEALFDELLNVETELITQYQNGQLSSKESEQFERYFLRSAERRNRLRAQTKVNANDLPANAPGPKNWWRRWLWRLGFRT